MNNGRMIVVLLLTFLISCAVENEPPRVRELKLKPEKATTGDRIKLYCLASDEENDSLTFVWSATAGEIQPFGYSDSALWITPEDPGEYMVTVMVSDGNASTSYNFPVQVNIPGSLIQGYVCFQGTKIPVPGAVVRMNDRETVADQDGSFTFQIFPGAYTLEVQKPGFENQIIQLSVKEGLNPVKVELFSTGQTCRIMGQLKNRKGEAIPGAGVVLLNPDYGVSEIKTLADKSGYYELLNVPRGKRTICFIPGKPYAEHHATLDLTDSVYTYHVVTDIITSILTGTLDHEGRSYRTVRIGNRWWMAENLAWLPSVNPGTAGSLPDPMYYVYGYEGTSVNASMASDNFHTFGVLYNWEAAINACPEGWHLSTDEEWEELARYINDQRGPFNKLNDDWYDLALFLKSAGNWKATGNGTNDFGFSAVPGGYRGENDQFNYGGFYGMWWTAQALSTDDAWSRGMFFNHDGLNRQSMGKASGLSVRCVRD